MVNINKWNELPEQYRTMILIDITRELEEIDENFVCSGRLKKHLVAKGICDGNQPITRADLLQLKNLA